MEYVVVRHGSYGLYNLVRKGGSDEGEKKPENRAVVKEYGGLYFFTVSEVKLFYLVTTPGVLQRINQLGVLFFF